MDDATWNEGANTVVAPGGEALIGGENTVYGLEPLPAGPHFA